jgi:CubicO group peptidase (beta-lactamase class C family)
MFPALVVLGACAAPPVETVSAAAPAAVPAVTLPDTEPAKRLKEVLEVINAGDRAALVEYAKTGFAPNMMQPDDSILDFLHGQYQLSGGYEVRRILQSMPNQITALVQGRKKTDSWLRYVLGTEETPPHRVNGIFTFGASAALGEEEGGPVAEADLPARFTALVDRIAGEGNFSGSVCLARDGKVLVNKAWGEADRATHQKNTPATRFCIASVGKLFTGVAIAKLVELGKLAYDDPVAKHLSGWLPPGGEKVTIDDLLTHRSGLGDYLEGVLNDRSGRTYDGLEDYRRFAVEGSLLFEPGTAFRYSNTGYVLLGAIIEKVTGEPWDTWVRKNVLAPAGISNTTAKRAAGRDPGIAVGYHTEPDGSLILSDTLQVGRGTPAGGGISTAEDLAKFADAFAAGRLVSKAAVQAMTMSRTDFPGTGKYYGYGVTIAGTQSGHRVYGHEGGFPGIGALVEVYEGRGYTLAVLSNTTGGAAPIGDAWRDVFSRVARTSATP